MTDKGLKFDDGKLDLTLIPWNQLNLPKSDLILPLYRWYRENRASFNAEWVFRQMDHVYREHFGRDLIADAAAAMNYGATKYEPWNWEKGVSRKRLYAAACRHYHAIERGEETDPESGLSHYEHLAFYPMAIFAAIDDDEPVHLGDMGAPVMRLADAIEDGIHEVLGTKFSVDKRKPVELMDAPELRI